MSQPDPVTQTKPSQVLAWSALLASALVLASILQAVATRPLVV